MDELAGIGFVRGTSEVPPPAVEPELSPRQKLVLCFVLLRGGNDVPFERLDADLAAWCAKYGEPTQWSVERWVERNVDQLNFCLKVGEQRHPELKGQLAKRGVH